MHTIEKKSTTKAWAGAIAKPAKEFPPTQLPIISGKIPDGLRGTLYRNGPARLERGGIRMGHWFDGDGAILAVNFTDAIATGVYRYVQTSGYQEEAAAGKLLTFRSETDISQEVPNAIARFDNKTETLTEADLGENRYPSEPIPAQDSQNPAQSWLLTVVYDGNSHTSEVWIFDSDRLDAEPLCKLGLPSVIPHGFHGTWNPA
ncbi:carotenoid oxygenase family protein [Nostoc sphaeroides]|uniref:carotenoid oxygenase family protein n=1 Tax=Nostoc sphaeroides TaxID=446679 RepID=UPI000E4DC1C0|nr:carotenoid oxygenase family protein [Nostoc sphaeroides]